MKWNRKRVLVTGGAGFLGCHLLRALVQAGAEVVVIDNFSSGVAKNIDFFLGEVKKYDISKNYFLAKAKKEIKECDYIFHLGAPSSVILFNRNPEKCMRETVSGFINIMQLAVNLVVRKVIYASSGTVYGDIPIPHAEDKSPHPLNLYGIAKLTCEKIAEYYQKENGVESIGLRIFTGYGPNEDHKKEYASPVTLFLRTIIEGRRPIIYGNGKQMRDFVYIDDITTCLLKSACVNFTGVVNVGTGKTYSFNELIHVIAERTATKFVNPLYIPRPRNYLQEIQADTKRMKGLFDISPISLKEGIDRYCRFLNI